jgi:hypothetical protein
VNKTSEGFIGLGLKSWLKRMEDKNIDNEEIVKNKDK